MYRAMGSSLAGHGSCVQHTTICEWQGVSPPWQDMSRRPPHLPIKADFINFILQQVWEAAACSSAAAVVVVVRVLAAIVLAVVNHCESHLITIIKPN